MGDEEAAKSAVSKADAQAENIEAERARYEAAWNAFDKCSMRYLRSLVFSGIVVIIVLLVGAPLIHFINSDITFATALVVFFILLGVPKFYGSSYYRFRCPRCGNHFVKRATSTKQIAAINAAISETCVYCGLSRGALPPDFTAPNKPSPPWWRGILRSG